jgi:hypothetical protein
LTPTHDGNLWIVLNSGQVSRLHEGHVTTFSAKDLPLTNGLSEDREGSIVAATAHGGLARFRNDRW